MGRILLQYLLPLILPTVLYFLWVNYKRRKDPNADISVRRAWFWLISSGCLLLIVVLVFTGLTRGTPAGGTYEPPRLENGEIVPSKVVPPKTDTKPSSSEK